MKKDSLLVFVLLGLAALAIALLASKFGGLGPEPIGPIKSAVQGEQEVRQLRPISTEQATRSVVPNQLVATPDQVPGYTKVSCVFPSGVTVEAVNLKGATELTATCDGLMGRTSLNPAQPSPEVIVQMKALGAISGVILDSMGNPLEGLTVMAFPEWRKPTLNRVASVLNGAASSDITFTHSDTNGRFYLEVPFDQGSYSLKVAGKGYCVPRISPIGFMEAAGLTLTAEPVFGVQLQYAERASGSPGSLGVAWAYPGPMWNAPTLAKFYGLNGRVEGCLLGFSASELGRARSDTDLIVGSLPTDEDEIGPLHLTGEPIGFAAIEQDVFIPRYMGGEVQVVRLVGTRSTGEQGVVKLSIKWPTAGLNGRTGINGGGPLAIIKLIPVDGSNSFEVPIFDDIQTEFSIPNVPEGEYKVNVRFAVAGWSTAQRFGLETITVDSESPSVLEFDLTELVSVEFQVSIASKPGYRGDFMFDLSGPATTTSGTTGLIQKPPYILRGLWPGDYTVIGYRPFGPPLLATFTVLGGDAPQFMEIGLEQ